MEAARTSEGTAQAELAGIVNGRPGSIIGCAHPFGETRWSLPPWQPAR